MYNKSLFIFRRDLRVRDNSGLLKALENSKEVIPCFIFDPGQYDEEENDYFSENCFRFMIECLEDLSEQLEERNGKLYFFEGKPPEVIRKLSEKIDAVYVNRDYTPFSKKRDKKIENKCEELDLVFHEENDLLLTEPEDVKTNQGTPYKVFTPFWKKARERKVPKPEEVDTNKFAKEKVGLEDKELPEKLKPEENENVYVRGGRKNALDVLDNMQSYEEYEDEADVPHKDATTGLSAHNKFGTVSIREVYHAAGKALGYDHGLIRQLYWRDFFTHIAYNFPRVFGSPFYKKFEDLWWENDEEKFERWCEGRTGFPIIDAGMRQLNTTGYMHNRVRMAVASFLIKDLHVDWRWGERYFAQQLVDYDPAVNNGNWQWAASTGCDAQPWFRIFNPWRQLERFDKDCKYVKKWVEELEGLSPKEIHEEPWKAEDYPEPVVDHKEESKKAKEIYEKANSSN